MRYQLPALVLMLVCATIASAERVPLDPAQLKKESTHIVTGIVRAKYSRDVDSNLCGPGTIVTQYILEIEVDGIEKGDDLQRKDFVYARCWRLKKPGALGLVPGPSGHQIPEEKTRVRAYLARGEYRPTGQSDRGFAVVYPNGIEILPKTGK